MVDNGIKGRPINTELTPIIVEAVLALLAEGGYARLTTAAVAKRAGVSTATLYRRWPSKRELLLAAVGAIADEETADVDTGSTASDVGELLAHKKYVLSGRVGATLVALVGEAAHDPELAAVVRASVFDPTREHMAAILERARSRGEQVSANPTAVTSLVVGTILARLAFTDAESEDELLSEGDLRLLVAAIAGSPGHDDRKNP